MRARVALWVAALAACSTPPAPNARKPVDAETDSTPAKPERAMPPGEPGAIHERSIVALRLSPDGRSALSEDAGGGVRLWPDLDAPKEPRTVPLQGARSMSLAGGPAGLTIALVDVTGGGAFFTAAPGEAPRRVATLPPFASLRSLEVLPGGERIVSLGKDGVMGLYDRQGRLLGQLEERDFRPERLCAVDETTVVAIGEDWARKLEVEPKGLELAGEPVTFKVPPKEGKPDELACSPDGKRVAYLVTVVPKNQPVQVQLEKAMPLTPVLHVIEVDGGADKAIPVTVAADASVGFVSPDRILLDTPGQMAKFVDLAPGAWWKDITPDAATDQKLDPALGVRIMDLPEIEQRPGSLFPQAYARGRRIAGIGAAIYVQDVPATEHPYSQGRHLGYEAIVAEGSESLSPSGKQVAWASLGTGVVYVEQVGGDGPPVAVTAEAARSVFVRLLEDKPRWPYFRTFFLDEDHLVLVARDGHLALVEVSTGKVLAHNSAGEAAVGDAFLDPAKGLLIVRRIVDGDVVFEVSVDRGFVGPHDLAWNGSQTGFVPDGDAVVWSLHDQSFRLCKLSVLQQGHCPTAPAAYLDTGVVLAVSAGGRWRPDAAGVRLEPLAGGDPKVFDLGRNDVFAMTPFGAGGLQAAVQFPDIIQVMDLGAKKTLWSAPGAHVGFSRDGHRAVIDQGEKAVGFVVYDAATGEVLHRRRAAAFMASTQAPVDPPFPPAPRRVSNFEEFPE